MMCIACDVQGGHGGNRSSDEAEQERAAGGGGGRANMHSSQSRGMAHQRSARPEPGGGGHQGGYDAGTSRVRGCAPAGRVVTVHALCVSGHTDVKGMLRWISYHLAWCNNTYVKVAFRHVHVIEFLSQ